MHGLATRGTAAAFALFSFLSADIASAQTKIEQAVVQELQKASRVRVIILTRPDLDQANGGAALSNAANYMTNRLGGTASNVKAIGRLAAASAEITQEALALLHEDPNVARVTRDIPSPPVLFDSVPQIGADRYHRVGLIGSGYNIAVLDTGMDKSHPALNGALAAEACFSTAKSDVYKVKSLCPGGYDVFLLAGAAGQCPKDVSGCDHGTHVAGIVAGRAMLLRAATPDRKFDGVAPGAGIVAVQVFSLFEGAGVCGTDGPVCVLSFTSDQLRALEYIYKNRGPLKIAAINMSLGSGYADAPCDNQSPLTDVISRLRAKGVPTVIAAGNDGYFDGIAEPACISTAVSVAAVKQNGELDVSYSNVSRDVTVAAPGSNITSSVFNEAYAPKHGTSMAAPHVAAALALLKQQNPTLTVKQLVELMLSSNGIAADPRTGTLVRLLNLGPLIETQVASAADTGPVEPGTVKASPVTRVGTPGLRGWRGKAEGDKLINLGSFIIKSRRTAADLKARLDKLCPEHKCDFRQIGTDAYKFDLVPKPGPKALSVSVPDRQQLQEVLGDDVKVFDNRLSRPQ